MLSMFSPRSAFVVLAGAVLSGGCAQTPTSPSSLAPSAAVAALPQTSPPVPPRLGLTPPRALGLTRFVAFGDSITFGTKSSFDARFLYEDLNGGYVERLQNALNTYHAPQQFVVINEGVPGELAVNAQARFRSVLANRQPQAILLLEGINDLSNDVSVSRIGSALSQLLDISAAAGLPVIIATMFQTYESTDPNGVVRPNAASVVPALNAEIRRVAAGRLNVYLVDLEPRLRNRALLGGDGLHLEDAGFDVVASLFLAAIEAAFQVRGSFQ